MDDIATLASPDRLIASVPEGHVYVRHLSHPDGSGPRRLPDPVPHVTDPGPAQWWPPVMLDSGWVRQAEFDVFHLHFGFDAWEPAALAEVVDSLHETGRPFVLTVHDLRNPHHADRALHDEHLDVLVPAADGLITLTEGAAAEIRRRWDREATVVPHPHVVDLATMSEYADRPRPEGPFRIGVHAKSLRASMDAGAVVPVLASAVADLPDAVVQVNVHRDVMEDGQRHDASVAGTFRDLEAGGSVELVVHDYLPDDELWAYLASLDVSVLPYRFGTHSGWLEACRDLGTTVVAPSCGYFADQGPVLVYDHDETGLDAESLVAAVRRAYDERPDLGVTVEERRRQREAVAAAHDQVYDRAAVSAARRRRRGA